MQPFVREHYMKDLKDKGRDGAETGKNEYDAVPGKGKPYEEEAGQSVVWKKISAAEAEDIRSNGMTLLIRSINGATPCLDIQEFEGKLFAKFRTTEQAIPTQPAYRQNLLDPGPKDPKVRPDIGSVPTK